MALVWNDSMSTGVTEIDAQHKELIRQVNALNDAMLRREGIAQIGATVDFLMQYAVRHFAHEENCMNQFKCPVALANKKAHEDLKKILVEKREALRQKGADSVLVLELKSLLSNWLQTHIMAVDTKLKPCANKAAA